MSEDTYADRFHQDLFIEQAIKEAELATLEDANRIADELYVDIILPYKETIEDAIINIPCTCGEGERGEANCKHCNTVLAAGEEARRKLRDAILEP